MNRLQILFKRFLVLLYDSCVIPIAWYGAYWLRFNLDTIPHASLITATQVLPLVIIVQVIAYCIFGLYRGVWRFASMPDLLRIFKAVLSAVLVTALCLFLYNRLNNIPRSVLLIHTVILVFLLGGSRLVYRWFKDYSGFVFTGKRVLIIGAGKEAEALVRSFRHETQQYKVVGFLDDDANNLGREIQGIRVVGAFKDFQKILDKYNIDFVVIAAPEANAANLRDFVAICEQAKMEYRMLPTISQLTSGQVNIAELREVALEDLLGRETVKLDWQGITQCIENKVVVVTGGGGSIGSELCRQVALLNPKKLIILDNNEYNLYSIELEFQNDFPNTHIITCLADVTDDQTIKQIFKEQQPNILFHAAAYKHVPLLEQHVDSAVHNNILGTQVVANAALAANVEKFVLISTDKAVNPTNAMGASKRVAEMLCQQLSAKNKTQFIVVRFGNVLGSRGSVIPLFKQQLLKGGPLTVTHPDIERFFMTIPEASQLILQALVLGKGGEIFVLDMGKPVKITYLAEQMIKLSGKKVGEDIEIIYTGLRPGEKLYEELFHSNEKQEQTAHKKIYRSLAREFNIAEFNANYEKLIAACFKDNQTELKALLQKIVPEYSSV